MPVLIPYFKYTKPQLHPLTEHKSMTSLESLLEKISQAGSCPQRRQRNRLPATRRSSVCDASASRGAAVQVSAVFLRPSSPRLKAPENYNSRQAAQRPGLTKRNLGGGGKIALESPPPRLWLEAERRVFLPPHPGE